MHGAFTVDIFVFERGVHRILVRGTLAFIHPDPLLPSRKIAPNVYHLIYGISQLTSSKVKKELNPKSKTMAKFGVPKTAQGEYIYSHYEPSMVNVLPPYYVPSF